MLSCEEFDLAAVLFLLLPKWDIWSGKLHSGIISFSVWLLNVQDNGAITVTLPENGKEGNLTWNPQMLVSISAMWLYTILSIFISTYLLQTCSCALSLSSIVQFNNSSNWNSREWKRSVKRKRKKDGILDEIAREFSCLKYHAKYELAPFQETTPLCFHQPSISWKSKTLITITTAVRLYLLLQSKNELCCPSFSALLRRNLFWKE